MFAPSLMSPESCAHVSLTGQLASELHCMEVVMEQVPTAGSSTPGKPHAGAGGPILNARLEQFAWHAVQSGLQNSLTPPHPFGATSGSQASPGSMTPLPHASVAAVVAVDGA